MTPTQTAKTNLANALTCAYRSTYRLPIGPPTLYGAPSGLGRSPPDHPEPTVPYVYSCPRCGVDSRRYPTNAKAQKHGHDHRQERHGGDHPHGETILRIPLEQRSPVELVTAFGIALVIFFLLVAKYG